MSVDFTTFLVLFTLITGAVWLVDVLWSAPARRRQGGGTPRPRLVEYAHVLFPVLLLVLLVRSFLVEPFTIPSNSMLPTLHAGDYVLVNKYAYGLRLPITNTVVASVDAPRRGDVAVFEFPQDTSVDYVKRIVALPGDLVDYRDKVLYINGMPQRQRLHGGFSGAGASAVMTGAEVREEHIEGRAHRLLTRMQAPNLKSGCNILAEAPVRVPQGHYFVMGDNRDDSNDSRCFGFVPDSYLRGRVFLVWMHWDDARSEALPVAFERIGRMVH